MKGGTGQLVFNYFRISGIDIDPTKIKEINLYESIEYPGITGTVIIDDWFSFRETFNIFEGDIIDISLGRRGDPPLIAEYVITDCPEEVPMKGQDNKYLVIDFCSKWLVEGFTQTRSKCWKNHYIHEIVSELVEACGGKLGVFAKTKQKLERFVSPYWSPIQTIRYLMSFAMDEQGNGGYLLFTDIRENIVNFIPYSTLISTNNYGYVPFKMAMNPSHNDSPEKIINMTLGSSFDSIKDGNAGLGRSAYIGFNYDKSEIIEYDRKIDQYKHNHLSTKLPLNLRFLGDKYRTTKETFLYPNTNELITDLSTDDGYIRKNDELIEGKMKTKQSLTFSDMVTLDIISNGEIHHRRAGRLLWIDYPAHGFKEKALHKQFTGTYLIKNINHYITGMVYKNIMTVICDGFKNAIRKDLISWNEENPFSSTWDTTNEG